MVLKVRTMVTFGEEVNTVLSLHLGVENTNVFTLVMCLSCALEIGVCFVCIMYSSKK